MHEDYPAIAARAKTEKAGMDWGHESGLHSDNVRARGFAHKAWLAEHADAMEVFYLPSYSPEPSPQEMANAHIKQALSTLAPAGTELQLVKATASHLRSVHKPPAVTCCGGNGCQ
jgi:hypothetical protein